jgi:tRNA modification GTPase
VTDVAGTTRDVLEETVLLSGIMLVLMDTAGIRQTDDQVEKIGVELAKKSVKDADLVLFVLDASRELSKEDREIAALIREKPAIVLWNKTDLTPVFKKEDLEECEDRCWISFSAKEEQGLEELTEQIRSMFYDGKVSFNDEVYITNLRHKEAAASAMESLAAVQDSIEKGMPEDFFSIDLMNAYEALGEIIGEAVDEDLVDTVFKEFCMGK